MDKTNKRRGVPRWLRRGAFLALAVLFTIGAAAVDGAQEAPEEPGASTGQMSASTFRPNQIKRSRDGKTAFRSLDDTDALVCENANLALFVDEERAVIKVQDKANGYVWSSGLDEADVQELTATWQRFAQALFVAEYVDRYAPTTPVREFPVIQSIVRKPDGLEF